jgi:glycine cleavage system H protein
MTTPTDLLFTKEHEWLRIDGDVATVGISDHAQNELGDVVYVELPKAGAKFDSGGTFGSVESVKAVSELFLPVSGEVIEINEELGSSPEKINSDPYGAGWMVRIRVLDRNETADLMSAEEYDEYTMEEKD